MAEACHHGKVHRFDLGSVVSASSKDRENGESMTTGACQQTWQVHVAMSEELLEHEHTTVGGATMSRTWGKYVSDTWNDRNMEKACYRAVEVRLKRQCHIDTEPRLFTLCQDTI